MKNHLKKVLQTAPRDGGIYIAHVEHDEWCPRLHGGADCICHPTVRYEKCETLSEFETKMALMGTGGNAV